MFKTIKLKILIPVLLITILSMVGKTAYDYSQFKKEISSNIDTIVSAKMSKMVDAVNSKLELWTEDISMLASTDVVRSMDWSRVSGYLSSNSELFSKYEMVLLSDRSGNAQTSSGTTTNISDRDYFKKAIQGETVISEPLISKTSGKLVIVVAVPVKDSAGNVAGVAGGTIEITDIAAVINSEKLGDSGYAFMTNKDGTVIVHNNSELILKENYLNSGDEGLVNLTKKMIAGDKGTMTYKFEGKDKLAAYAPIEATGWSIAMTGTQQELYKAVNDMRTKAVWLTIILLIPLVGIIYFIVNAITKSIKKLTKVSDMLAVGNMNVSIDVKSQDEVGQLAVSFKKMVENIREQAVVAQDIAEGNLDSAVKEKSEEDILSKSLNLVVKTLKELVEESRLLTNAAVGGRLEVRGSVDKFKGGYRYIVQGVNDTLDAVIQPIKEASEVLQEMSKGNLQVGVEGNYKGDHAEIKEALNRSIKSFNEVLNDINNAADQVAGGAKQVSDSSQSLSQGTTEQASSIEEITASITEVAAQTKQNAVNAGQANALAEESKSNAISGNEQMKEMLKAMEEINESSGNISKIIKVIDEIAFQTNILALNAAVEAARAGQHGKGFAVVAEEVRNLAARSANAAKETTDLIESSIKKVDAGTKIAKDTADALSRIVEGVSKATELVSEIASASNEQATGIAQVNQAINQVSQVTQMNTATAEESASASEELASQAELLKAMIEKFKLAKTGNAENSVGLSPEIMRMLESMAGKNNKGNADSMGAVGEAAVSAEPKLKISLDDKEFGKY